MIIRYLLLAVDQAIEIESSPALSSEGRIFAIILNTAGTLIFLGWAAKIGFAFINRRSFNPLENSPARRNCLPVSHAVFLIFLWLIGSSMIGHLVQSLFHDTLEYEIALNAAGAIWYLIMIVIILAVVRLFFPRGIRGFGLKAQTLGRDLFRGSITLAAIWPLINAAFVISYVGGLLIFGDDFEMAKHSSLVTLEEFPNAGLRAALVINAVLVIPCFEEILFRGLIQTMITTHLGKPWISILLTSAVFASFHLIPSHWILLFILSVGLGYAYEKSGSLIQPIWMHILFNGIMIFLTLTAS